MHLGDFVFLCLILLAFLLNVRYVLKNGVDACGGDCSSGCHSHCKWVGNMKKAQKRIARIQKIKSFLHLA